MKIYLVRHGETEWNKEYRLQGQADTRLNDYGRELAQITAEALKDIPFDVIYHSPLNRAEETAVILKKSRTIDIIADERIKEMSFGTAEGCHILSIKNNPEDPMYNFLKHPGDYIPPENGERFEEVAARSAEFMEETILPLEGKYQNVLIVAHGAVNRTILNAIAGIPVSDFWNIRLKNCAVSIIDLTNGILTIEQEGAIYYPTEERPKDILN
ncbi:MAG: histidine phosphatase family protein [Lachnospiraceae bacterium]|nr:histidine phosphatase family protein [Lachnospiraceae bacterium]